MPNQYNFRSDVTTKTEPTYLASRIVRASDEGILYEQIPASFGFETYDVIEFHFYSIPDNDLVLSTVLDVEFAEEVLKSHIVEYGDGTFKNYIRIDFTKLFELNNVVLIPGDYRMVLNFFSDEIGDYNDRKLYIQDISDSRTEVQLAFFQTNNLNERLQNEDELREFVTPSFDKPTAVGVGEKIFASGVRLQDSTEGITYENIVQNIDVTELNQTFENTIARINKLGPQVVQDFQSNIEDFLVSLFKTVKEEIIIKGDRRIQEDEFQEFINTALEIKIKELQQKYQNKILIS